MQNCHGLPGAAIATEDFRYWAFLSYSHADESVARKLHLALERYTLPRRLRKVHGLPRRLIPVFRDVEELEAASALTGRLQAALDQSRWLIVLCSPAAAQSKYVNAEIEHYIGKHGARRVLCALAEGEPADSFPHAIQALKDEPLASDFRPGRDFELARLKLIAALAGVGFTELRNREAQRRRRTRLAIAAALTAIGIGAVAYWDLFYREHIDCYANYTRRHGIWQGIDRVSAEAASHRAATYRFTRHGRLSPPDRVDYVNGSGTCAGEGLADILQSQLHFEIDVPAKRYCAATFDYARDGRLERESLLNGLGKPKQTLAYSTPELAQFTLEGYAQSSDVSGVNYVQFKRDDAGFDAQVQFLYARGIARANAQHAYGFAYTRDAAGRVVTSQSLDDQGRGTGEVTRLVYGPTGDLRELRHEDAGGHLRTSDQGYAIRRFELDAAGNVLHDAYLSAGETLTMTPMHFAGRTLSYDARGNPLEICYLDDQGHPVPSGNTTAECDRYRYDEHGRPVWIGAFDQAGHPTTANLGIAATTFKYDASGSMIESRNFDQRGALAEETNGIALTRLTHDERGNILDEYFYGADGKPGHTGYGARIHHAMDLRDRYLEFSFFDGDGKPFVRPDSGYASVHFVHDERGNTVQSAFLGPDLQPILCKRYGTAYRVFAFDDQGNQIEVRGLDVQRRVMKDVNHVAIYRREFNALGQQVLETYFDEQERPTLHKQGYYGLRTQYDHRGREAQRVYLDARRGPMLVARLGGAGVRYEYDALGRVQQEIYLDTSGAPLSTGAVQRMQYARDKYGAELSRRYYGPGDALTASPASGCAIETRTLDALGHLIREQCLDAQEHLRNRKDGGWAQKLTSWDHGRMTQERYLDTAGRPVQPRA